MASKTAKQYGDAYFTKPETVRWCYERLSEIYDLKGKTAFEPACGSGAFVKGSEGTGLVWKTNELFPQYADGFQHDFNLDFGKEDLSVFGRYDFVITNPPFGHSSMLARKFVKRSLEIANVVAMVLPKGCRRHTAIDKDIPQDVKLVLDLDLPNSVFELPDGTERAVGCVFLVYERVEGYTRGFLIDPEPEGYRAETGKSEWPEWATHGVGCLHTAGRYFGRERGKGYLETYWLELTPEQAETVAGIDWQALIARTKTSIPRLVAGEVRTRINQELRIGG